jgi:hypothetical protein
MFMITLLATLVKFMLDAPDVRPTGMSTYEISTVILTGATLLVGIIGLWLSNRMRKPMNHEEQCSIVRDLMPLVIDGVAGEASRALVEPHLAECPDCCRVMEDMRAGIKARASDVAIEENDKIIRFCLKLRKPRMDKPRQRKRRRRK